MKLEPSEELAYWVGAVQTDGSFKTYFDKWKDFIRYKISFTVETKSLPMVERFRELSMMLFKRHGEVYRQKDREVWDYYIQVKGLLSVFDSLDIKFGDPPIPPKWVLEKPEFFGAYLAGLIDGDGTLCILKFKGIDYCRIRIISGKEQVDLASSIRSILQCGVHTAYSESVSFLDGRQIIGHRYHLMFLVSKKTLDFFKQFVISWVQITHKREKLEKIVELREPN